MVQDNEYVNQLGGQDMAAPEGAPTEMPAQPAPSQDPIAGAGAFQPEPPAQQPQQPAQPQQPGAAQGVQPQPPAFQQAPQPAFGQPAQGAPGAAQRPAWQQAPAPQQGAPAAQAFAPGHYQQGPGQAGRGAYANAVPYQPAQVPQKGGKGWIVAIVIIVCLFAFTAFAVHSCTTAMGSLPMGSGASSYADITEDTIGVIDIDGTIQYDGTLCSPEGLKSMLDEAQDNPHIKAIVLRVNSGGGVATAGEEMATYLEQFTKPVVVSSASINASAAYEISSQADYIYVAKSTELGAIGTVMELTDLSGLLEKLGVKMETIASAESKDSSYGYRPLTDEEREYYKRMVEQINGTFVETVAKGRGMDVKEVEKLATGLVYTGIDAVENGLADAVGTREDAVKKAAELAEVTDYDVVNMHLDDYDLSSLAYLLGESKVSADDIARLLDAQGAANLK